MHEHLIAYELVNELQGTVTVDGVETPKFGGGLIALGDGDVDLAELIDNGAGVVVVRTTDSPLIEILNALPAFKRAAVPDTPAAIVSPHDRRSMESLLADVRQRGLRVAGGRSRKALVAALDAHDAGMDPANDDRGGEDLSDASHSAAASDDASQNAGANTTQEG